MKIKKIATGAGLTALLLAVGLATMNIATTASAASTDTKTTNAVQTPMQHRMENQLKDIQRNVENLDNGVKITVTSSNADTVTKLQSMKQPEKPQDADSSITVTHANISNGVEITITSTDAATITKIQEDAKNGHGPGFGRGGKGMGGPMMFDQNVDRKFENIDNGVKMTMTSTDATTITKLQSMKQPTPKDTNVTVNQTNLSNGVEITMTSDDAAIVTKLQNRPMHGGGHIHGQNMRMNNNLQQ